MENTNISDNYLRHFMLLCPPCFISLFDTSALPDLKYYKIVSQKV